MTLKTDLVEKRGKLEKLRKDFGDFVTEAGGADVLDMSKVKLVDGDNAVKVDWMRNTNKEMRDLSIEVEGLVDAIKSAEGFDRSDEDGRDGDNRRDGGTKHRNHDADPDDPTRGKSLGVMLSESKAIKGKLKGENIGPVAQFQVPDLKTLFSTSAGWAPQSIRTGRVVDAVTRPIQVIDSLPLGRTSFPSVVYMLETTRTNNAAEVSEGGTYPESALALSEQNSPVRKIATFLPVTDEQLEDIPGIQTYIDNRLTSFLRQRLDSEVVAGDGNAPNLLGIVNVSGIQTQALGSDSGPDAIFKAMTKVRVTGRATPTALWMHPTNWQDIRLLTTVEGVYIWGSPADAGIDRIWGLSVTQAEALSVGTAVLGDFATHSELVMRKDIDVQVSNSHGTFFIEGKQAIRCDMRAAFVVYRPAAFCTVTGL